MELGEWIDELSAYSQFQMQCLDARRSNRAVAMQFKLLYSQGKELFTMTPQEELHSKFFLNKRMQVIDMDVLQLRAHREELALIAFKARAEIGAVDEALKEKEKKNPKAPGFSRSLQMDDVSSDAINSINQRKEKLSKDEKMIERMRKMGIPEDYIQKAMSNMSIHKQIQKAEIKETKDKVKNDERSESKPFVNPFAIKKDN